MPLSEERLVEIRKFYAVTGTGSSFLWKRSWGEEILSLREVVVELLNEVERLIEENGDLELQMSMIEEAERDATYNYDREEDIDAPEVG